MDHHAGCVKKTKNKKQKKITYNCNSFSNNSNKILLIKDKIK